MSSLVVGPLTPPDVLVELIQRHTAILIAIQARQLPSQLVPGHIRRHAFVVIHSVGNSPVYFSLCLSSEEKNVVSVLQFVKNFGKGRDADCTVSLVVQ